MATPTEFNQKSTEDAGLQEKMAEEEEIITLRLRIKQ